MLDLVGLGSAAGTFPHELSGGQQQRVALARALAPEPDLLLLDEPFSNLDIDLRERLSIEVREIIKATGTTAILVTHDQHEAFAIADEIGIMHDGRIEQWDTAYNLYHQPTTRFVADFVGQGVFLRGIVAGPARVVTELGDLDTGAPLLAADGLAVDLLLRPDDIVHDDASAVAGRGCGQGVPRRRLPVHAGARRRARGCCRWSRRTTTTPSARGSASGSRSTTSSRFRRRSASRVTEAVRRRFGAAKVRHAG